MAAALRMLGMTTTRAALRVLPASTTVFQTRFASAGTMKWFDARKVRGVPSRIINKYPGPHIPGVPAFSDTAAHHAAPTRTQPHPPPLPRCTASPRPFPAPPLGFGPFGFESVSVGRCWNHEGERCKVPRRGATCPGVPAHRPRLPPSPFASRLHPLPEMSPRANKVARCKKTEHVVPISVAGNALPSAAITTTLAPAPAPLITPRVPPRIRLA